MVRHAAAPSVLHSRVVSGIAPFATLLRRYAPQPLLGLSMAALGLYALAAAWAAEGAPGSTLTLTNLGLAAVLAASIVVAKLYPVHVARGFKVSLQTVPLYLLTVLTPPAVAASSAGLALLAGELAQRHVKGQLPSDIAATVGRWVMLVALSGMVAHWLLPPIPPLLLPGAIALPLGAPLARLPLLLAAGLLWLGDALTVALEIGAITGEAPRRLVRMVLRDGGLAEGIQYLAGLLGALAARQDAWAIVLLLAPAVVTRRLLKHSMEMNDETRSLLESMADAVDLRDPYTGGHSRRVTAYTDAILRALNISGPEARLITAAARVHDIGKIAIPDRILNKPERLTEEERAVMESHPRRGAEFLARYRDFQRGTNIVLSHHERIDGKGYPQGLHGDDIPFGARVIAVADSFDAMTSDRPYRQGMAVATAAAILSDGRGAQWESRIVDAFVEQVIPTLCAAASAQPDMPSQGQQPATVPADRPTLSGHAA